MIWLVPPHEMRLVPQLHLGEPDVRAHPMRVGSHRQCPSSRDAKIEVHLIADDQSAMVGAPDKSIEQTEPLHVARLERLPGQGHECARQRERASGVRHRIAGAPDGPGQTGRLNSGEHERPGRAPPTRPVGLMGEGTQRHRWRVSQSLYVWPISRGRLALSKPRAPVERLAARSATLAWGGLRAVQQD